MVKKLTGKELEQKIKKLEEAVHNLRQALNASQESEKRFRSVIENSPNSILISDRDGIVQYINRTIHDITPNDVIGRHVYDFEEPEYHDLAKEAIEQIYKAEKSGSYQVQGIGPDASIAWYDIHFAPIKMERQVVGASFISIDITERKQAEDALKKAHNELDGRVKERTKELAKANDDLKVKAISLEEANTALRVVLKTREQDKSEIEKTMLQNIKELVSPFLVKLKNANLDSQQMSYANIIESNLDDILSPFLNKLSSKYSSLTPSEIQVAFLVKEGKTTKEIAEILHSSIRAIEFHRENLRKKLGLTNKKANLRSHLLTLL